MPNECDWVDAAEVRALLQQFRSVQQQRVHYYAKFQEGFQTYAAAAQNDREQDQAYSDLVSALTTAFQHCSEEVIGIETKLRDKLHRPDLAGLLRTVQEHEREKLRMTVVQQALKKAQARQQFTWMRSGNEDLSGIGTEEAHACAAHAHGVLPEPSRAEFEKAMAEATQDLQAAVNGINDSLEELRYVEQDLQDQADDHTG
ncbi:hypothetical protein WJX72_004855 [[Myrmecia] bisecta]|uniref:Uncharacterized protein n=1 Tax=[Myrmecia] bisecta TaxID=41462 RepID=A0AAW1Q0B7_9CHLO